MSGSGSSVGEIRYEVLSDGFAHYAPEMFAANVQPAEVRSALADRIDHQGRVAVPYGPQLVSSGRELILVDAGIGELAHAIGEPAGRLQSALKAKGVQPEDITIVVITHCHPDHIGGLTQVTEGSRRPVFPGARHVVFESEWSFWTSDNNLSQLPDMLSAPAREHLPVLSAADLVHPLSGESELVPGVRIVPAPGHTPGHVVVRLSASGGDVVLAADALVDRINLDFPDWVSPVDTLPDLTIRTRHRLLDMAAAENLVLIGYHLPEFGRIHKSGATYRLEPLTRTMP